MLTWTGGGADFAAPSQSTPRKGGERGRGGMPADGVRERTEPSNGDASVRSAYERCEESQGGRSLG
jgi:hypothetical protein